MESIINLKAAKQIGLNGSPECAGEGGQSNPMTVSSGQKAVNSKNAGKNL
jgi:hypothetical protein